MAVIRVNNANTACCTAFSLALMDQARGNQSIFPSFKSWHMLARLVLLLVLVLPMEQHMLKKLTVIQELTASTSDLNAPLLVHLSNMALLQYFVLFLTLKDLLCMLFHKCGLLLNCILLCISMAIQ